MTVRFPKSMLTGKSLSHQLAALKHHRMKEGRMVKQILTATVDHASKPVRSGNNLYYHGNLVQEPAQFKPNKKEFNDTNTLIGREIAEYATPLLSDLNIVMVPAGFRQVIKNGEIYNYSAYQIINHANYNAVQRKAIAEICDKSWRV